MEQFGQTVYSDLDSDIDLSCDFDELYSNYILNPLNNLSIEMPNISGYPGKIVNIRIYNNGIQYNLEINYNYRNIGTIYPNEMVVCEFIVYGGDGDSWTLI